MDIEFPLYINELEVADIDELSSLADNRNGDALYYLGVCYLNGLNVKKDAEKGTTFYRLGAFYGSSKALLELGFVYEFGIGISKNISYAVCCYISAYNLGDSQALVSLGQFCINDSQSEKEVLLGKALLRKAKDLGNDDADYFCTEYYPETLAEDFMFDDIVDEFGIFDDLNSNQNLMKFIVAKELANYYKLIMDLEDIISDEEFFNAELNYNKFNTLVDSECFIEGSDDIENTFVSKALENELDCDESCYNSEDFELFGVPSNTYNTVNKIFEEERFHARQGSGFAAERANDLHDRLLGRKAKILGDDNALNGADRIVDGQLIQSKYYTSGGKCVESCFRNGKYKYIDSNGKPMQLEVPKDKKIYDSAVKAMKRRIKNGEVPGITDEEQAKDLIRRGNVTYKQAKNIAKAGNIDSIVYDIKSGLIMSKTAFGISASVSFATAIWNGSELDEALKISIYSGIKTAGVSVATLTVANQIARTSANKIVAKYTDSFAKFIGSKNSATITNIFRNSENSIYGAAAQKSASKIIKGNIFAFTASMMVLSAIDIKDLFEGRISDEQLFKNVMTTATSLVGGSVGGLIGGAFFGPIGYFIGSCIGGHLCGTAAKSTLDDFIEDDAKEMQNILSNVFCDISQDYLLTQDEVDKAISKLKDCLTGSVLKDMYASADRVKFAELLITPVVEKVIVDRETIEIPSSNKIKEAFVNFIAQLAEEQLATT